MNIDTRIDRERRLRTHVLRGAGRLREIRVYLEGLFYGADFEPTFPAMWDVREADFSGITPDEVKDFACYLRDHWSSRYSRKMAIVVGGDLHFGLSRMLEQFTGPTAMGKFRSFRDPQSAIQWLESRETAPPMVAADS